MLKGAPPPAPAPRVAVATRGTLIPLERKSKQQTKAYFIVKTLRCEREQWSGQRGAHARRERGAHGQRGRRSRQRGGAVHGQAHGHANGQARRRATSRACSSLRPQMRIRACRGAEGRRRRAGSCRSDGPTALRARRCQLPRALPQRPFVAYRAAKIGAREALAV